jgi:hypothetical protein
MIGFEFDTKAYQWTHGRHPKGYGTWAFQFQGSKPVWAPAGTYGAAKLWVKQHIRQLAPADYTGTVIVTVCT